MGFDYSHFFNEEEEPKDEFLEQQYKEFVEVVRTYLLILLLVSILCFIASYIISYFQNVDLNSEVPSTRQDRLTYWVAIKLCMFGLAIAIGIALLLPMTIVTNEFVLRYNHLPQWTWLNDLLIKQLWHYIFIFSNLCFILIPFSYFFAESTGFSRSTDNFCSRILQAFLETQLTLTIILSCIFLGLSTLFPIFQPKFFDLVTFWLNFPFLYSCISFAGAILLLVCTPKGILNLVIILDEKLTRPYRVNTTTERYDRVTADIDVLLSRLQLLDRYKSKYGRDAERKFSADTLPLTLENVLANHSDVNSLSSDDLLDLVEQYENERQELHQKLSVSWIRAKIPWLLYPLAMVLIISTTAFSCAIVFFNLLGKLFNVQHTRAEPFVLGIASISKMGLAGAFIQVMLIVYFAVASFVGLYTLPVLSKLRPLPGNTPFFKIMLNCMVLLILSSALPLFTRTVGITNFDLFGNFGQIEWTQNYHLVLVYNCAFLVALVICLCHSIVVKLSREFFARLHSLFLCLQNCISLAHEKLCLLRDACSQSSSPAAVAAHSVYSPGVPGVVDSTTSTGRLYASRLFRNTLHSSVTFIYSVLHFRPVDATTTSIKESKSK